MCNIIVKSYELGCPCIFINYLKTTNELFKVIAVFFSTYLCPNTQLPSPTPIEPIDLSIPSCLPFSDSAVHTLSTPHPQRQMVI